MENVYEPDSPGLFFVPNNFTNGIIEWIEKLIRFDISTVTGFGMSRLSFLLQKCWWVCIFDSAFLKKRAELNFMQDNGTWQKMSFEFATENIYKRSLVFFENW